MFRLRHTGFLAIVFMLLLGLSCKKPNDTVLPRIVMELPVEGSTFNIPNSIPVKASIGDERQLESVSITLLNADQQPAFTTVSFPVEGTHYELDQRYPLEGANLASGNYFLRVKSSDGTKRRHVQ